MASTASKRSHHKSYASGRRLAPPTRSSSSSNEMKWGFDLSRINPSPANLTQYVDFPFKSLSVMTSSEGLHIGYSRCHNLSDGKLAIDADWIKGDLHHLNENKAFFGYEKALIKCRLALEISTIFYPAERERSKWDFFLKLFKKL